MGDQYEVSLSLNTLAKGLIVLCRRAERKPLSSKRADESVLFPAQTRFCHFILCFFFRMKLFL